MKVIFHPRFYEVYTSDPAAASGRMEAIVKALEKDFEFIEPEPASERDLQRVHGRQHIQSVKSDPLVYEIGLLAAGGAILAGELGCGGEPAFGLIRPPGHHASPHSCWGFCYFNNIAIAIKKLLGEDKIKSALILDFDLHYGDGTANTFNGSREVSYFHPEGRNRQSFLNEVQTSLQTDKPFDIIGVSAGFDRHEEDWGGLLKTEDYLAIGKWVKQASLERCQGRRFAVLEGGYNHSVLGRNVIAFLEGFNNEGGVDKKW
ncbi:MAG: histone deacetylase family protein [Deltaproteobacteria bacterium]|nr:histone deacetylase family protein [Deltaproteobacteria bacterium]